MSNYPFLRRGGGGAPPPPPAAAAARRRDGPFSQESSTAQSFEEQAQTLIPAEFYMISGCHSFQTSADLAQIPPGVLPNPAGKAGGACTSCLLEILYRQPNISYQDLLLQLRASLVAKGLGEQVPQLSSSRPLELGQTPFTLIKGSGTCRALLVGINYRGQNGELSGCHNDVKNVKNYLVECQGYKEHEILMLLDDENKNLFPTRQKIIENLSQMVLQSKSGDNCYFHYSGHGGLLEPTDNIWKLQHQHENDSHAKKEYEETLYPVDHEYAGQICDFSLYHSFVQPMKAGVTVTCVFDCCHSGTVLNLPYQFQPTSCGTGIRSLQSMDSLANLAFLGIMAGQDLLSSGVLGPVLQHLQQGVDQDLEHYLGIGLEQLLNEGIVVNLATALLDVATGRENAIARNFIGNRDNDNENVDYTADAAVWPANVYNVDDDNDNNGDGAAAASGTASNIDCCGASGCLELLHSLLQQTQQQQDDDVEYANDNYNNAGDYNEGGGDNDDDDEGFLDE